MTDVLDESVDQMYWDTSTDPPKLRAGSTPVSVAHLSDTQITGPTNGQVLTWNSGASKWENEDSSGGGSPFTANPGELITSDDSGDIVIVPHGAANQELITPAIFHSVINASIMGYHAVGRGSDAGMPHGNLPTAFTVECRYAITSASSFWLVGWGSASPGGFSLKYVDATHIEVADPDTALAPAWTVASQSGGVFRKYTVTWDGVNLFELFIDGVSQGTKTLTAGFSLTLGGSTSLVIGGETPDAGFDGSVLLCSFYSSKLSGARIAAHQSAVATGTYVFEVMDDSPIRFYKLQEYPRSDVTPGGFQDTGSQNVSLATPAGGADVDTSNTGITNVIPEWGENAALGLFSSSASAITQVGITDGATPGTGPTIGPLTVETNTKIGLSGKGNAATELGSSTSPVHTFGRYAAGADATATRAIDGTQYTAGNYRRMILATVSLTAAGGTANIAGVADAGGTANLAQGEFTQEVAGTEVVTLVMVVDPGGHYSITSTVGAGASATLIKWIEVDL